MKSPIISVRELLEQTISELEKRFNPKAISLGNGVLTEIANDSDWHRTREGYMMYSSAGLYTINDKTIILARGTACGSYPADPYDSDIMAFEFKPNSDNFREELKKKMRRSSYFQNSILIGLKSGQLAYSKNQNPMINKFSAIIEPRVLEFTADQMRINRDLIDPSTMSYLVTSPITYKPNFPKFLADSFERVLNEVKDDSRNIS